MRASTDVGSVASPRTGNRKMTLPTDPQGRENLAKELAYNLSWSIWKNDHMAETHEILRKVREGEASPGTSASNKNPRRKSDMPPKPVTEESVWKNFFTEKRTDTIAVGISRDGKEIVIAGNLKKRTAEVLTLGMSKAAKKVVQRVQAKASGMGSMETTQTPSYTSSSFGFHDSRHEEIIRGVIEAYP